MTDRQRNGFILILVVGLIAASIAVLLTNKTVLGLDLKGGVELVYQGEPTAQTPTVTQDALSRAVDIMRSRVDQLGVAEPEIQTSGGNQISVGLPDVSDTARAEALVGTTAQLEFYDWEANVLTPNGKTVASQLQVQDPTALEISQGSGSLSPGDPGVGSMALYEAVKLASKQPAAPFSSRLSHIGPQYYMFGAPGSAACEAAAKANNTTPASGQHCLLSGPDANQQDLLTGLPAGVSASEGRAADGAAGVGRAPGSRRQRLPSDELHEPGGAVLRAQGRRRADRQGHHQPAAEQRPTGAPDVTFGFTGTGAKEFRTSRRRSPVAARAVSTLGTTLNQHFAVALDNKLITVPAIDFKQYPRGDLG